MNFLVEEAAMVSFFVLGFYAGILFAVWYELREP